MSEAPRRWSDAPPEDREAAAARALIETAGDPRPSPHARARVWQRLQEPAPRRVPMEIVGATAAGIAVVLLALMVRPAERNEAFAELTQVDGVVERVAGESATLIAQRDVVTRGARLRTRADGRSVVTLRDVDRLTLASNTDVTMGGDGPAIDIALHAGAVTASVEPRPGRAPFVVTAGQWRVHVVGTIFDVRRIGEDVLVSVSRGAVEVRGPKGSVRVAAGERFDSSAPGSSGARAAIDATDDAPAVAVAAPHAGRVDGTRSGNQPAATVAADRRGAVNDVPRPRRKPRGAANTARARAQRQDDDSARAASRGSDARNTTAMQMDGRRPTPTPTPSDSDANDRQANDRQANDRQTNDRQTNDRRDEATRGDERDAHDRRNAEARPSDADAPATTERAPARRSVSTTPEIAPRRAAPPPMPTERAPGAAPITDREAYRRAVAARDPSDALQQLDRIAGGASSYAELAAYRAAVLTMRLGRHGDAAGRLEGIRGKFPAGTLEQEVHLSLIECRTQLGHLPKANTEVASFLARYPKNERRGELRFLRGEIARKDGRCADAIEDYRAAASSRRAEDALYFAAWCALDTGDRAEGEAILRNYLERFESGRHASAAKRALGID